MAGEHRRTSPAARARDADRSYTGHVATTPRYQPYLDVAPAPFRWRLGLRPLDLDDWLILDEHYTAEIERKQEIMAANPATAFRVLADIEPEATEIRDAVVEHLRRLGDPRVGAIDTTLHPLDAAARQVQEDLVVLVERDGQLVCGGGSVCFPNRWDLASKVGRTMAEIHEPVAQLNDHLAAPIDKFLGRLTPDRPYWRLGWGVLDTPELYQATDGSAPPRPEAASPDDHYLRVERETLRRFPQTGCILFTIRTFVTPLGSVPVPTDAATLADAIEALPADVAEYKQLDEAGQSLASWLRQLATTNVQ